MGDDILELRRGESDRSQWPDRAEVAKLRGCSIGTVRNLEKRGILSAVLVNGVHRFDPRTVESAETAASELTGAELLTAAASLLRQAEQHNERLVELFTAPLTQLHTSFSTTQDRLLSRVDALEKKNAEMLKAGEEALSLQHERHLAALGYEASEKRKSRAFESFIAQFPDLAAIVRTRFGGAKPSPATTEPASSAPAPSGSSPTSPVTSAAPTETPPVEPPPKDDEEAAFQVLRRVSCLSDDQISTMARAGFITAGEAVAFRMHRDAMNRAEPTKESSPAGTPPVARDVAPTPEEAG